MKKILLPLVMLTFALPAFAEEAPLGIAAVVNDEMISYLDLEDRVKLVIATTGLSDAPEVHDKLRPQLLRKVIDEKLQLQAATAQGISVGDDELKQAIGVIEQQNRKPQGSFEPYLANLGVSKLAFYGQLRAQIAWSKLVMKKLRPKIRISDSEVEQAAARSKGNAQEKEVQIATITLPVDKPENDDSVRKLAEKLLGELQGGADFTAVAAQFSENRESNDATWVHVTQLEPQVAEAVANTQEGAITKPIRTPAGYNIIKVLHARSVEPAAAEEVSDYELALRQILLTLKPTATKKDVDILLTIAKEVQKNPGTCTEEGIAGFKDLADADIAVSYIRRNMSALPIALQSIVQKLDVGAVSDPFATPEGLQIVMLCERIEMPGAQQNDALRNQLFQEKLMLEAAKYMRSLRREAFLDVRIK